ncbi:YicC/YloC family endoribonuclease, partial [Acinetobacter baumannii]
GSLEIDAQALERLTSRVREIARLMPEGHMVNVLDVLRWPGVLRGESDVGEELLTAARSVFVGTVDDLVAARAREGVRLRELL